MTSQTADIDRLWIRSSAHAEDITTLEFGMEKLRGAVISDAVRLNAHAEDITQLAERLETLEVEQAGNDRAFREVISDNAELARHIEELEEKQANAWAENVFVANGLAQRLNALVKRIEQLERLLERGDTNDCGHEHRPS